MCLCKKVLVMTFKRLRQANTAMQASNVMPVNAAMPANTAMPMFLTSCETELHI